MGSASSIIFWDFDMIQWIHWIEWNSFGENSIRQNKSYLIHLDNNHGIQNEPKSADVGTRVHWQFLFLVLVVSVELFTLTYWVAIYL